jgi:hypothetical protein
VELSVTIDDSVAKFEGPGAKADRALSFLEFPISVELISELELDLSITSDD